jgi:hypothetical protein
LSEFFGSKKAVGTSNSAYLMFVTEVEVRRCKSVETSYFKKRRAPTHHATIDAILEAQAGSRERDPASRNSKRRSGHMDN